MARYFFHLHDDGTVLIDHEGQDCGSLEEAGRVAVANARDIMIGELRTGRLCLACFIAINDAADREVARVSFRDAVAISGLDD